MVNTTREHYIFEKIWISKKKMIFKLLANLQNREHAILSVANLILNTFWDIP